MIKDTLAFILPGLGSGGAERVVTILANRFSENFRVVIITLYKTDPFYPLNPEIEILHCFENAPNSKNVVEAIASNYRLLKSIAVSLKKEKVKVVIGFLTSANVLAVLAAKLVKIPVLISERNNPYRSNTPQFWRLLRRFTYPLADFLIVQTNEIKKFYVGQIKSDKLVLIPNPISPELTSAKIRTEAREKIILNVGRFADQKAQHVLIKAFAKINNDGWRLHIVGKGKREREYQHLISSLNLEGKVVLIAPTTDIEAHYRTASIFAFVSIFEGFPNALIEAMHFSLPCISTDCPTGPAELIVNNKNGFLIPINDQNSLEHYLLMLMENEDLRKCLGEQAQISVKRFEMVEIAKKWENLISQVVSYNGNYIGEKF